MRLEVSELYPNAPESMVLIYLLQASNNMLEAIFHANMPVTHNSLQARADRVRGFNRFYTRLIGLLDEHLLDSDFSLTEARVLYELAHRKSITSSDLCAELGVNAGYVSRVVSGFEKKGLLARVRSSTDARVAELQLTDKGARALAPLEDASCAELMSILGGLSDPEQHQLIDAMSQIESLLGEADRSFVLRDPQPGDMALIVHRQTVLYVQEYGWTNEYEALASEIVASFIRGFKPKRERCWIAEKNGKVIGSVFVVEENEATAKLRLLYVDASARGLGVGSRLVDECIRFARNAGYSKMILWTNSVLTDARRIYERAGFQLTDEEAHHSFGKDLIGQTWELQLAESRDT